MAAITAFTYTLLKQRKLDSSTGVKQVKIKLQAGDGVLTYPTGGIAVDPKKLGLPAVVESLFNSDSLSPDGFVYKYNQTSGKLMMFGQDGTTGALVEISNASTPTININVIGEGY